MSAADKKSDLVRKLGIRPGARIAVLNEPDHYWELLGELPSDVEVVPPGETGCDLVHLFSTTKDDLTRSFQRAKGWILEDGMIWVSWPKRSSPLKAELKDGIVREVGLAQGLVDVKVAAIDSDWSGLKFVYRLEDRSQ